MALSAQREVTYRRTPRGATLYTCAWRSPSSPPTHAAALFLTGYNSYQSFNHDWLASHLLAHGIAPYGFDHHGFGRSTQAAEFKVPAAGPLDYALRSLHSLLCCHGRLAYIPRFSDLISDAVHIAGVVAALEPGVPLFLIGESMGGTLALEVVRELAARPSPPLPPPHLLLLAPMCSLGSSVAVSPLLQAVGAALACIAPLLPTPTLKDTTAMHVKSPERLREVLADPLRWQQRVRLGTAFALKGATADAQARLPLYAPSSLLLLHCTADVMCPLKGTLALLQASPCADRALVEYEGALHTLWAEPVDTRRRLLRDVVAWIAARAPGVAQPGGALEAAGGGAGKEEAAPDLSRAAVALESAQGRFLHARRGEGGGAFADDSIFTALQHQPGRAYGARGAASVEG